MSRLTSVVLALLWLWGSALPLAAQTPNRAGLVVVNGDGVAVTRCVEFAEESISGAELLARSGLALRLEATGMGATVCSIEGEGCGPGSNCFCQCQSSPCLYWAYWQLHEGAWRYANLGAGMTEVRDGMVEGWVWGEGNLAGESAGAPPDLSYAGICSDDTAGGDTALADVAQTEPGTNPATLLVVAGAPLMAAALWWWRRQRSG